MKKTYLVKENDQHGNSKLVEVTGAEWYSIVKRNKALPAEEQRYFISDVIEDGFQTDVLIMEVSREEYQKWKSQRQKERRDREEAMRYRILSLDEPVADDDSLLLSDLIDGGTSPEDKLLSKTLLGALRQELNAWRPWAGKLLELYLKGEQRSSTAWLSTQCGVTEQMARRYKKEFEVFVKKFLA